MSQASSSIEQTIKALVEFESELDKAKSEAQDSAKKLLKDADDWAQTARTKAVTAAQQLASERMGNARDEAEKEAASIRKKGEAAMKDFEASISKRKGKGAKQVLARLLGEAQ